MFFLALFLAHSQAVIIPVILGIKSFKKFDKNKKNNDLITFGFISFGLASLFEMIDHTKTAWIYVNHTSIFNWLFYSFLSLGLSSLSIAVIKNKLNIIFNLLLTFFSICSYLIFDKEISLLFQVILSIILIINWQRVFKDLLFIFYPIFGIFFTTFIGTNLSNSGNQIWHIFIGPCGTVSLLTFYLVLKRSEKK